jgi:hypothetical protein
MATATVRRAAGGDRVKEGLSELRTAVLGPQILLGFQYEALFQPGFEAISPLRRVAAVAAFALLLGTAILLIAPAGFHQLAEAGERTNRQAAFSKLALTLSLLPFAAAIGLNVLVAAGDEFGGGIGPIVAALAAAAVALALWYGIEIMLRRPGAAPAPAAGARTSLKDRVADLMTETRIVLPGVQALLGFQFAAFLSDAFRKLPADARAAHDAGLGLLLVSMILLMTPGPFHRLAENGEDTPRFCRVGAACIVAALATLALGLAADFYVVLRVIAGSPYVAVAGAALSVVCAFALWFACPLLVRRRGAAAAPARPQLSTPKA